MSYFSKFPGYLVTAGDRRNIIITDFFRHVSLGKEFNSYAVFLLPYLIEGNETPEMVANKIYRNPLYHWVILLTNGIVDARTEWVLSDEQLNHMLYEKYDFEITVPDTSLYSVNDVVTSSNNGEFIVTDVTNTTIFLRSQQGPIHLVTTDTLTNVTKDEPLLAITAVTDPTEYIHHYIDSTNNLIIDFDNTNPNIVAITNFQYEEEVNESKRLIRVLDPKYLDQFVRDFDNIINR